MSKCYCPACVEVALLRSEVIPAGIPDACPGCEGSGRCPDCKEGFCFTCLDSEFCMQCGGLGVVFY